MSGTKDDILNLAEQLIRTSGYHAFSYADISRPLHIKNAAIHYHYPSKKDLGMAVIQRNRDGFEVFTEELRRSKNNNPVDQLKAFIAIYTRSQENNLVCFMGALGQAFNGLPAEMQHSLAEASTEIRTWVTNLLEQGRKDGWFEFKETAKEKADLIISSLLASLIVSRVADENILENVKNSILASTLKSSD